MTTVKICGLRTAEHALAALHAGADLLGFILAPSRRQISPSELQAISAAVRAAPGGHQIGLVGVFVNEAPSRMSEIARLCDLDAIQLSGTEHSDVLAELPSTLTVLKTLRLAGDPTEQGWLHLPAVRLHIDAHVPGTYGGAGVRADWQGAAELALQREILLAGGLTPDSVTEAIAEVRPWGVDVSSGIETNGVKDADKIRAFVAAAHSADRQAQVARL